MATYQLGVSTKTPLNALGGAQYAKQHPTQAAPAKSSANTRYWVVSRGFAGKLQGYKAGTSNNGTLYAVFASYAAAVAYQKANKMRLYTSIVTA
jgi:hypothetical protein